MALLAALKSRQSPFVAASRPIQRVVEMLSGLIYEYLGMNVWFVVDTAPWRYKRLGQPGTLMFLGLRPGC